MREHGYDALQIVHFHLPSRDTAYLAELKAALAESGIALDALLVDDGDLTAAGDGVADAVEAWIGEWLDTAAVLGARRARVCAGRSAPTAELIAASARRLARLAAAHGDVRVVTENWLEMIPTADVALAYLDAAGDDVGLLIDLGNWQGAEKYDALAQIAPRAETCHAKCHFTGSDADADDYLASLRVLRASDYDGPLALIYDGENDDEWAMLDVEYDLVRQVFD